MIVCGYMPSFWQVSLLILFSPWELKMSFPLEIRGFIVYSLKKKSLKIVDIKHHGNLKTYLGKFVFYYTNPRI